MKLSKTVVREGQAPAALMGLAGSDALAEARSPLSISRGVPLVEEPGLGALTLPGYLREVTERYADREALVFHHPDGVVERWSYAELWDRSVAVARALVALGVGKDSRVGIMMTNRPEWLSAFFGVMPGRTSLTCGSSSPPPPTTASRFRNGNFSEAISVHLLHRLRA